METEQVKSDSEMKELYPTETVEQLDIILATTLTVGIERKKFSPDLNTLIAVQLRKQILDTVNFYKKQNPDWKFNDVMLIINSMLIAYDTGMHATTHLLEHMLSGECSNNLEGHNHAS